MRDLDLWRRLQDHDCQSPEVLNGLRELASWQLGDRWAYLGFLPPLLKHTNPEVREAALLALGGAWGYLAIKQIVVAFHDSEPRVRLAAVEALRATAGPFQYRFVHALFHPDPEIRRAAIAPDRAFPLLPWYQLYLLPDPACADVIGLQLDTMTPPAWGLPLLFELVQAGHLPRPHAAGMASRIPLGEAWEFLQPLRPRPEPAIERVLSALELPEGRAVVEAEEFHDSLDDFLDLFWDEAALVTTLEYLLRLLPDLLKAGPSRRRVAAAIVATGVRRGTWLGPVCGVCAVLYPRFLDCKWIPRNVRREALAALYQLGSQCPRLTDVGVQRLLASDLAYDAAGRLDLWAIGGLLHLFTGNPYQRLFAVHDVARIVDAIQANLEDALAFLGLPDNSPRGRRLLVREICSQPGGRGANLLAVLARAVPSDALDFLEALDGRLACLVFEHLTTPAEPLAENKTRRLAELLAPKIAAGQIGLFLRLWLDQPVPESCELGLFLLARLARDHAVHLLHNAIRALEGPHLRKFLHATVHCAGFPYAREIELAEELAKHPDPEVRAWCEPRLRRPVPARKRGTRLRIFPEAEDGLAQLKLGLCAKLRGQPDPPEPDLDTCLALLGCHDPLTEIDEQFARFSSADPEFVTRLDIAMVETWQGEQRLPLLGHAWLYRWDRHAEDFVHLLALQWPDGFAAALSAAERLKSPLLRERCWEAVARILCIWNWRTPPRLEQVWDTDLGFHLVEALTTSVADPAARLLLLWHSRGQAPEILALLRPRLVEKLLDAPEELRRQFAHWIDLQGLAPRVPAATSGPATADAASLVAACEDVNQLAAWARQPEFAEPAAAKLVQCGTAGLDRLVELLREAPVLATLRELAATVSDWPETPHRAALRRAVLDGALEPEACFRVGQALLTRGTTSNPAQLVRKMALGAFNPAHAGASIPTVAEVAASTDLDFLTGWANHPHILPTFKAVERLLQLEESGMERLALLLAQEPTPTWTVRGLDAMANGSGPLAERARRVLAGQVALPHAEGDDADLGPEKDRLPLLNAMIEAVCRPGPAGWFDSADWFWLLLLLPDSWQAAFRLIHSPHPHAYTAAVRVLCQHTWDKVEVVDALRAFLEIGTDRPRDVRLQAAEWLARHGHGEAVLPVLLRRKPMANPTPPDLFTRVPRQIPGVLTQAVLLAGMEHAYEEMLLAWLSADGIDPLARDDALAQLLLHGESREVRYRARQMVKPRKSRDRKLRAVAETFAWGIRTCRELTGKMFTIEMISGDELGYTRFNQNKLFISPMPILRADSGARDVVKALILHEVGHHMYHRGPEEEKVWAKGREEQLHPLLNLVSDEHLERNLRAMDRGFGDRLKLLVAYAFQHTNRDQVVETMLQGLQGRAFDVLTRGQLDVSRHAGCVTVQNGRLLLAMEKAGLSFARFVRALRMGLGNRHDDPKVAEGLALFRGRFRRSTMPALLDIARKLREIFGQETELLNPFDTDTLLPLDADELDRLGEGLTNEEIQSEVRRVLEGRSSRDKSEGKGGIATLNVNPNEEFTPITQVVPIAHDPAEHAKYAAQVAHAARRMRQYFQQLGLSLEPQRFRLRGKSFDRTRTRAVVLRGDPRMLVAREIKRFTDLFVGVVVDCSGSMAHGDNIEKARLFGSLLAEAARGNPCIDLRLFGFTDEVIYDAGHANRCAVHGLVSNGGNNDSAGLWHAAQVALASKRKAKLLVMISDGLPTECSVASLQALVHRLTRRWKMCCAQVAVRPLEEVCFPNYVLLEEDDLSASVRAFGQIVARLVRKALGGG